MYQASELDTGWWRPQFNPGAGTRFHNLLPLTTTNPLPQFDSHNGVTHDTKLKKEKYHIKYPIDRIAKHDTGAPNSLPDGAISL